MVRNQKVTGNAMPLAAGVGTGVAVSGVLTLLGAALLAWLINGETMPFAGIGYGAMIVLAVSSAVGSWIAAALVKHRRLAVCMITGAGYLALLLGITAFCFGGQFQGVVPTVLLTAGGCAASALAGSSGQGSIISGRHNRRYG